MALIFVNIIVAQIWLIATIFGLLIWQRGGEGSQGGDEEEENRVELAVILLLVGLWWHWTARMRMTVVADGTRQQPTP